MADETVKIEEGKGAMVEIPAEGTEVKEPTPEPTREEMEKAGFSAEEIEMAEKQGTIKKPAEKSEADKASDAQKIADEKAKLVADKKLLDIKKDEELTPEEEHEKLNTFNANEKALYFKQKKERQKRQEAQAERDLLKIKNAELEKRLKEKEVNPPEVDEFGDPIVDDPDRLITAAELEKRDKDKKEKEDTAKLEEQGKQEQAQSKLKNIYEKGRTKHTDFDKTMELAKVVLDTNKSFKVKSKLDAYYNALASEEADSEEEAADIAYEIGKLHPDYKAGTSDTDTEKIKSDKAKLDKILANQSKSKPSAAIGGSGGGQKIISEDDLTPADVSKFSKEKYRSLSKKTKDRILLESCG